MKQCSVYILDEVNCVINGLSKTHMDYFYDQFGIPAPNFFFSPKYKLGVWDGKIRYFSRLGATYVNLLEGIVPELIKFGYDLDLQDKRTTNSFPIPTVDANIFSHIKNPHTGEPMIIRDYQVELLTELFKYGNGIAIAATGSGKALSLNSKILTPGGWVLNRNIKIGDVVVTPNNTTARVVNVFPQPLKQLYRVTFSDGASVETCEEHLWLAHVPVKTHTALTTQRIIDTKEIIEFLTRKKSGMCTPGNISIPVSAPLDISTTHNSLPIDPYLLGALIGDGCLRGGSVIFSNKDPYILNEISATVKQFGLSLKHKYSSNCDYDITKKGRRTNQLNPLTESLKSLGVYGTISNNKFIPENYKTSSIADRWALIQGLCDTDGTAGKKGNISFTTVSKQLAKDVQEIVWSLGGVCTVTSRTPTYTYKGKKMSGQLAYTCFIAHTSPKMFFRTPAKRDRCLDRYADGRIPLTRRVISVEPTTVDYSQCIEIDSVEHLYITDDYIVTHNTLISAGLALGYEKAAGFKSIIIVPDKNLTEQTRSEYEFFGLDVGEYSGSRKDYDKQHIVATWQTLQNNPNYIQNFQVVICDECQGLRGNTISKLLNEYGKNIPVRFGLTGTLPKEPADALAIKIAVGDVRYTIPAHKLIKQQYLSDLKIDIVQLETNLKQEYEKHIFDTPTSTISYKDFKEQYIPDFSAEQRYVQADNARIDWIAKDIEQRPGNTLCLVSNIKFGKKLTKAIDGAIFLYGKDEMKVRKQVYELFKDNDNIKVIANLQIASTGLNIPRIFNLYLIDIGKSFVRTIQSIGRGLRKAHDKDFVNVVDICSDLKYSNRHMKNRMKYYTEAKYPFEHRKVKYKH